MRVVAPFTVDHLPTVRALRSIRTLDVERWKLSGPNDYLAMLTHLWELGEPFVNVEHDVEFPPGTVEEVARCPGLWCWHPYVNVPTVPQLANLGLTKFSAPFIAALPYVWTDFASSSEVMRRRWQRQPTWSMLDAWLIDYAEARGYPGHAHHALVVNRRPDGVERMRDDSMAGFLHG